MLEDIQWTEILSHLYHLGIAYLLAIPIGWDRESRAPGAGIRTFPLVAMASCAYMLTGIYVLEPDDARARVMYGILTGIGFIGGGSILKEKGNGAGTATAASIWSTGAIGIAVAWNRLEIALTLSIMTFLTLRFGKFLNGGTTEDQSP